MRFARHPLFIAFSVIAAVAFAWIWIAEFDVSPAEVALFFATFNSWFLVPIALLLLLHVALSAWRWILIEHSLSGVRPSFRRAMTAGVYALGLGNFLPAPLVNVACRSISNRLDGTSALRGALSGGLDQLSDLFAVSLVAIPAILAIFFSEPSIYLWGAPLAIVAGAGAVLAIRRLAVLTGRYSFKARAMEVASQLQAWALLRIYAFSIARVVNLHLITLAIHAATDTASVTAVLISVPIVTLAIAALMLPGGIGVSEWSFSAVFAFFAIPSNEIVIFVLANRIILTGISILLLIFAILFSFLRLSSGGKKQLEAEQFPSRSYQSVPRKQERDEE